MTKTYKFVKDPDESWYMELPEWIGSRAELQMVAGADTMLDIVAQGESATYMTLSDDTPIEGGFGLKFINECCDGGNYIIQNHPQDLSFDVWLCHVTKFVFGDLPKLIYVK